MVTQLSPGVYFTEVNLTTTVPGVSTGIGAIAGAFSWGPALEIRTIGSETEQVDIFFKPNNENATTFFTAANYASYSKALKIVRGVSATARNAVNNIGAIRSLAIVSPGSYLTNGSFPLVFTGGAGSGAVGTAVITGATGAVGATGAIPGTVTSITLTNPGLAFTSAPTVNVDFGATGILVSASITPSISNATQIKNESDYTENFSTGIVAVGTWVAKYPGAIGNTLKVSMADAASFEAWAYKSRFNVIPGTSAYTQLRSGAQDELHAVVVDEDGIFSGVPGTILEVFPYLSKAADAKSANGESSYYKQVINARSRYINWANHPASGTNWGSNAANVTFAALSSASTVSLTDGSDGAALSAGELIAAYDLFAPQDTVDINFLLTADHPVAVVNHIIDNIAEVRRNVVVFVSPPKAAVVDNINQEANDILTYRNVTLNKNSSYVVMDSGWKYQLDRYNDLFRWIPLNGDVAGLTSLNEPWVSPAGLNRGFIKNVIRLAYNPTLAARDELSKAGVNSVVMFSGQGTVLWGDKTLLSRPSIFDRIGPRRLFIALQRSITEAAKYTLFESNDDFTRARFVGLVEPYLREIQGRRGLKKFEVVCNETNNTPQIINSNSFVADIYIVPQYSINTIQLNFVGVPNGVELNVVVGQF